MQIISELSPFQIVLLYIAAVSVISVITTIADKLLAAARARRVSEATLFMLSALGGSAAMFVTMIIIRHKTRKPSFMIGIPVMVVFQAVAIYIIYKNMFAF